MIHDDITKTLAEAYTRMLAENAGLEAAAAAVHKAWMGRNPKSDYNAAQHVDYADLPEEEKQKDRDHVIMAGKFFAENPRKEGESETDHHARIAGMIGSHLHDDWRSKRKVVGKKADGTPQYEPREKEDKKVGGKQDIANTPFHELTDGHKEENFLAGHAAVAAHRAHMGG